MAGNDKAAGRVTALIVLLLLAAAALRGYLPASERPDEPRTGPASSVLVVALLSATLGILALAIIAQLRDRSTMAGNLAGLAEGAVGARGRLTWRLILAVFSAVAVILGWLLIMMLLAHLVGQHGLGQHPLDPALRTGVSGAHSDTPAPDTAPPRARARPQPGGNLFAVLAASLLVVAVGTIAAAAVGRARRRTPARPVSEPGERPAPPGPDPLMRAAQRGLAEVGDRGRGPREAIIACYATMERELAQMPEVVPQDYDTPSEVLARAVNHHALHADNAAELVKLFTEARFSPHLMTEEHRDAAVRVLSVVLTELPRSPR